jgi:hypothetical protein
VPAAGTEKAAQHDHAAAPDRTRERPDRTRERRSPAVDCGWGQRRKDFGDGAILAWAQVGTVRKACFLPWRSRELARSGGMKELAPLPRTGIVLARVSCRGRGAGGQGRRPGLCHPARSFNREAAKSDKLTGTFCVEHSLGPLRGKELPVISMHFFPALKFLYSGRSVVAEPRDLPVSHSLIPSGTSLSVGPGPQLRA